MSGQFDQNQVHYQSYYRFPARSRWMDKIWKEAFEEQHPEGIDHYGYLTNHDLRMSSTLLQDANADSMLDIGCGKGGPGLRLAEQLQLRLTGIDIIPEAV